MDIRRPHAKLAHQGIQSAKTLARTSVTKPMPHLKKHIRSTGEAIAKQPLAQVLVKSSVTLIDGKRLKRANHITQSNLIKHFTPVTPTIPPLVASVQPLTASVQPVAAQPTIAISKTEQLLKKGIERATSHEQPKLPKKKARKGLKIAASALSVFAVVGLIGMYELPNIRLHMASQTAGFAASLPAYKPSGYRLGKLNASLGAVAVQFKSNSDDRAYSITEKTSNWDSETLRQSFVAQQAGRDYQTVEAGGRTIYIYGDRTATWVNGGVWYSVDAQNSLSQRELIELATSF